MNKHRFISLFIIFSVIHGGNGDSAFGYFTESSSKIISTQSNQIILGSAALAALAETKVDHQVKSYAQKKGLLSDDISHFGDMYGGYWGHWLLWSSILATSLNDGGKTGLTEKLEFSKYALNNLHGITLRDFGGSLDYVQYLLISESTENYKINSSIIQIQINHLK